MAMADRCLVCTSAADDEWVQCDGCEGWVHFGCVDIPARQLRRLDTFRCRGCELALGQVPEQNSHRKRRRTAVDYAKLDRGIVSFNKTHPHVRYFEQSRTNVPEAADPRFDTPVVIRQPQFDKLDMKLPPDLTVAEISEEVGLDTPVPVVDAVTQDAVPGWTLATWRDYFEQPAVQRKQTYNVISLEISQSELAAKIRRPRWVEDHDLVDRVWPANSTDSRPQISLYCLMGTQNSFTDWHVDFAGSSVFYHLISGRKTFAFLPPTPATLAAYEKWCLSSDQQNTWLPSLVRSEKVLYANLFPGDSMVIPSGWIHAVYTPEDSVVIGGNFLTAENLDMQFAIVDLEERTRVPRKYRFPKFVQVMRYTGDWLHQSHATVPQSLLEYLRRVDPGLATKITQDVKKES